MALLTNTTSRSAIALSVYALSAILILTFVYQLSAKRIAASQAAALAMRLSALLPSDYDNDPAGDVVYVSNDALGTSDALPIYRARRDNLPLAAVLTAIAPDGYNGSIHLLLGVHYDGSIIGVRVTRHRETPGLGDDIDHQRSNWIYQFDGLSQQAMPEAAWRVKKDGGRFDQFTGATITPRAVVAAVHRALDWYLGAREQLFADEGGRE